MGAFIYKEVVCTRSDYCLFKYCKHHKDRIKGHGEVEFYVKSPKKLKDCLRGFYVESI